MSNKSMKKNEHDLQATGKTLGQQINTNTYNENYTRKKGMRFFVAIIILIFVAALVFLSIKPYSDIIILYADDSEITLHEINVSLFGGFSFKKSYIFDYHGEDEKYGNLVGKAARVASLIRTRDADLVISDSETLLEIGLMGYTEDHSRYTGRTDSEILLRHDLFENDSDLLFGLKIPELDFIVFNGEAALAITDNVDSRHDSPKEWGQLIRFIDMLYEGKGYIVRN